MLFVSPASTGWMLAAWVTPPPPDVPVATTSVLRPAFEEPSFALQNGISVWLANAPPPSKEDITLLRSAFAEFYGVNRDLVKAEDLLTQTIEKWQGQPEDEVAGLYRVRGDCYLQLANADKAVADYDQAVKLLRNKETYARADPSELPAALLGRARATKSLAATKTAGEQKKLAATAAADYREALVLSSREDWNTEQELLEDGASRNPFAAWEYGTALRWAGQYKAAADAHALAAEAFDQIGDRARSVISFTDAGVDLSGADQTKQAVNVLQQAVKKTKGIEGRDVSLLQRVISKEGEGRMALAALLWSDGQRAEAETVLGEACLRMEQLQASMSKAPDATAGLSFSIDDDIGVVGQLSCSRFKKKDFLADKLGWPENLQAKVIKLEMLR